jgi:hypothetical protein
MKKILLRVLMGLGALLLLGGSIVGFKLFKLFSLTQEVSRQQQLQQEALVRLKERYPFTAPGKEGVLALSEERLSDYLTIREKTAPAVEALASKRVELQEAQATKGSSGFGDRLEASQALLVLTTQARAVYIEALEQHRMSPDEFRGLTRFVYSLHEQNLGEEKERFRITEQQGVQRALAELQGRMKDDTLSPEQRSALEMKESQYKSWLKALEVPSPDKALSEEARATYQANRALVKKHGIRVAKAYDINLDDFTSAQGTP